MCRIISHLRGNMTVYFLIELNKAKHWQRIGIWGSYRWVYIWTISGFHKKHAIPVLNKDNRSTINMEHCDPL